MRHYFGTAFVIFLASSTCAATDARRYEKSFDCGFVQIQAKGAECVSEVDCPSLSYVTHEDMSYRSKSKAHPLPALTKQLPHGKEILHEPDRIYRISQLKCQEGQNVAVLFWGGGNCRSGCEVMVSYSATTGRLVPQRILKGSWDLVPFVKHYSTNDNAAVTKWIDPRP